MISKRYAVWCDGEVGGDSCPEWVEYAAATKNHAVRLAREDGGACHGGEHYCPDHNTK